MNEQIILDRILNDANTQAENIINEANQEIENLKNSLNEYDNQLNKNTNLELEKYKSNYLDFCSNDLQFKKGKLILEIKNQVINNLKEKAIEKINSLEKSEKIKFFEQILIQNAEKNEILTYNINNFDDEDFYKIECVKTLNLQIKKDLSINQGMVLSTDIYDKNLSLKNIVEELYNKKQQEICKILF
ncbi:MAG: hypothetical protein IJX17_02050 [Clostridia bacterium]|nr:hypothetical protein [Clostridia bacterium]